MNYRSILESVCDTRLTLKYTWVNLVIAFSISAKTLCVCHAFRSSLIFGRGIFPLGMVFFTWRVFFRWRFIRGSLLSVAVGILSMWQFIRDSVKSVWLVEYEWVRSGTEQTGYSRRWRNEIVMDSNSGDSKDMINEHVWNGVKETEYQKSYRSYCRYRVMHLGMNNLLFSKKTRSIAVHRWQQLNCEYCTARDIA